MKFIRISVTDLDSYLYWLSNEDMTAEEFVARLRREGPETRAMTIGRAFHKALEHAQDGEFHELRTDDFTFFLDFDADLELPAIRECKAEKRYQIGDTVVELVGMVDAIEGNCIYDHKTTAQFDAERFIGSYQWRAYLDIFDADVFRWNVFELRDNGETTIHVRSLHPLAQYRYPDMREDLDSLIAAFVGAVKAIAADLLTEMQRAA